MNINQSFPPENQGEQQSQDIHGRPYQQQQPVQSQLVYTNSKGTSTYVLLVAVVLIVLVGFEVIPMLHSLAWTYLPFYQWLDEYITI